MGIGSKKNDFDTCVDLVPKCTRMWGKGRATYFPGLPGYPTDVYDVVCMGEGEHWVSLTLSSF